MTEHLEHGCDDATTAFLYAKQRFITEAKILRNHKDYERSTGEKDETVWYHSGRVDVLADVLRNGFGVPEETIAEWRDEVSIVNVEGGVTECAENNDNGPKTLMEWLTGAQEIANALRRDR